MAGANGVLKDGRASSEATTQSFVQRAAAIELVAKAREMMRLAETLQPGINAEVIATSKEDYSVHLAEHWGTFRPTRRTGQSSAFSSWRPEYLNLPDLARRAWEHRRLRESLLDPELLGEPAWDILLDLMGAEGENKRLSVTGVCYGAGVSTTTALRWINILEDRGLIARVDDVEDKRRHWIVLTDAGRLVMDKYFAAVALRKQP